MYNNTYIYIYVDRFHDIIHHHPCSIKWWQIIRLTPPGPVRVHRRCGPRHSNHCPAQRMSNRSNLARDSHRKVPVGGWFTTPLKIGQLGWLFLLYGKQKMFQTTNQYIFSCFFLFLFLFMLISIVIYGKIMVIRRLTYWTTLHQAVPQYLGMARKKSDPGTHNSWSALSKHPMFEYTLW